MKNTKDWAGNSTSVFSTLSANNHSASIREANDFYATDPVAIDKLLAVYNPKGKIWECACGEGHLSERLIKNGYDVISTDLIDRGYGIGDIDFLNQDKLIDNRVKTIITNPPYKFATEFVKKRIATNYIRR